jgi:hypothetical protein
MPTKIWHKYKVLNPKIKNGLTGLLLALIPWSGIHTHSQHAM